MVEKGVGDEMDVGEQNSSYFHRKTWPYLSLWSEVFKLHMLLGLVFRGLQFDSCWGVNASIRRAPH